MRKKKRKKRENKDMGTFFLTGIMSVILTFSLLMMAASVTETDITLWEKTRAVPVFLVISGLLWWYFWRGSKKENKDSKKMRIYQDKVIMR